LYARFATVAITNKSEGVTEEATARKVIATIRAIHRGRIRWPEDRSTCTDRRPSGAYLCCNRFPSRSFRSRPRTSRSDLTAWKLRRPCRKTACCSPARAAEGRQWHRGSSPPLQFSSTRHSPFMPDRQARWSPTCKCDTSENRRHGRTDGPPAEPTQPHEGRWQRA